MNKNKSISLADMLANTDSQDILRQSKYRPEK